MNVKNRKVTILTNEYPPNTYGGAGVFVGNLSKYLSQYINVEVRAFGRSPSAEVNKNLILKEYSNQIYQESSYSGILNTLLTSITMLAEDMTDVVHSVVWYTGFAAFLAKKLYNIPCVVTPASLEYLRPWKEKSTGNEYQVSSYIEELCIKNADHLIAISSEMKQDLITHFNIPSNIISVIPPGVEINKFRPIQTNKTLKKYNINKKFILFVGRKSKQKGIENLIEALDYITSDIQFVFCLGRADDQQYSKYIDNLISSSSKANQIIAIHNDHTHKQEELIELYSHAQLFIVPSIYEPFGIVNIEAMSCGTPVLASARGGMKDIISEGENGFFVDTQNSQVFADRIDTIINDHAKLNNMSKSTREFIINNHDWQLIAQKYINIYNEILS